ncbi:hypothetical protein BGZ76_009939 [Entomortierella beljakovae]|nr:hypothetical protein BGZ76_009939 [Entomortierella beljakovae]
MVLPAPLVFAIIGVFLGFKFLLIWCVLRKRTILEILGFKQRVKVDIENQVQSTEQEGNSAKPCLATNPPSSTSKGKQLKDKKSKDGNSQEPHVVSKPLPLLPVPTSVENVYVANMNDDSKSQPQLIRTSLSPSPVNK